MPFNSSTTDVDFRPWAAFVSGHHPFDLLNRHLILDTRSTDRGLGFLPERGPWDRIPRIYDELSRSLRILAKLPTIETSRLSAFQNSLEEIIRIDLELKNLVSYPGYESSFLDEDEFGLSMSRPLGEELASSIPFIKVGDELREWQEFGAALGKYKLNPGQFVATGVPTLGTTMELARELRDCSKYPAPSRLLQFVEELDAGDSLDERVWPSMPIRKRSLYRSCRYLSCVLRNRARPERWIELDKHRLNFFGARFYIDTLPEGDLESDYEGRIPKAEAAFFWVLADYVGQNVLRKTIRDEGELARDVADLQFYKQNLLKLLKDVVLDFFKMKGMDLPQYAKECFILGLRGKYPEPGPYSLRLDRDRVWVSPERPSWMGARWHKQP